MEKQSPRKRSITARFSYLELLAVAVVCISLVAVAVPKYIQADVTSDIAEAESELQALAIALELYAVDNSGAYPSDLDSAGWPWYPPDNLSTPIEYISSATDAWLDPFRAADHLGYRGNRYRLINYESNRDPGWPPSSIPGLYPSRWIGYWSDSQVEQCKTLCGEWRLSSVGPDGDFTYRQISSDWLFELIPYDPTNGVISDGELYISEQEWNGTPVKSWKEYE